MCLELSFICVFLPSALLKSNLKAFPVEFSSGRSREGQAVPQVAGDAQHSGFSRVMLWIVVLAWGGKNAFERRG